ncbi:MAG: hypothetical protein LUC47_05635, partial [Clostridiales bacterium]|nr:hypothetical protein [Clostridiales bacterium]
AKSTDFILFCRKRQNSCGWLSFSLSSMPFKPEKEGFPGLGEPSLFGIAHSKTPPPPPKGGGPPPLLRLAWPKGHSSLHLR